MDIKSAALEIQEKIVSWRRDLHRIPELSFELHRTAEYLQEQLDKMRIPWESCAKTGIVALLQGKSAGPAIALRADMDALEIKEETGCPSPQRAAACTPAVTTPTWPCSWGRRR